MPYVSTMPVVFPYPPMQVYDMLCDLSKHPLWSSGMLSISTAERMREGMRYQTESTVAGGKVNVSEIEVVRLVPGKVIELVSDAGLVAFKAVFTLRQVSADSTDVVVTLKFELRNYVLNLARPVMENMAQERLRGDLKALRVLMADN